eukprot:GHUV01014192.1.p2 GENE.GHUV01014192.1~~GHUV01014192.1.p2  ORF type:complete len:255 (+),score=39.28 GHUV01014192.1:1692-2456(+)
MSVNASNSSGRVSGSGVHSAASSWADLTALTSLSLSSVHYQNKGDVAGFNSITSLRCLMLGAVRLSNPFPSLAPLTQLTWLTLQNMDHVRKVEVKGLEQLSQLQRLKLAVSACDTKLISGFSCSLTRLESGVLGQAYASTTAPATRLCELTVLLRLEVHGRHVKFGPRLLSQLVQLQHLDLGGCRLQQNRNDVEGVQQMLAVLPGLSQLQHLNLAKCMFESTAISSAVLSPSQQLSAHIPRPKGLLFAGQRNIA